MPNDGTLRMPGERGVPPGSIKGSLARPGRAVRELGDVRRDTPRLVVRDQSRRRAPAELIFEI